MTNSLTTQTAAQIDNVALPQTNTLATGSSRTITVRPSDIKAIIDATFPDYKGQKAAVSIQPTASYDAADLTWQGGSKTEIVALRVGAGGTFQIMSLSVLSPWSGQSWGGPIPADIMLVEHVIFCGKDLGIRCIVSPDSQFLLRMSLPAVVELSRDEIIVLSAHAQLKSGHYRDEAYQRAGMDVPQLKPSIEMLAYRGFLKVNKAGASSITVEGRNALASLSADRKVRL